MLPVLSVAEIKAWEAQTLVLEKWEAFSLMQRAAKAFCKAFAARFKTPQQVYIWAGTGNNGGDGLCIAHILSKQGHQVKVCCWGDTGSALYQRAYHSLHPKPHIFKTVQALKTHKIYTDMHQPQAILVDALFGIGLNRPLGGRVAQLIHLLNTFPLYKIAVDMPSGLCAESINRSAPCTGSRLGHYFSDS